MQKTECIIHFYSFQFSGTTTIAKTDNTRHLRSANQHQLTVPRCRRITFGRRAFSVAGPTVWNSLPTEFRCLSNCASVSSDSMALRKSCIIIIIIIIIIW